MKRAWFLGTVVLSSGLMLSPTHAQTACTVPDLCTPAASFISDQSDDRFGNAVDLKGDLVIVGAMRSASCGPWYNLCGAAFIYRKEGSTWVAETTLRASDAQPGNLFGQAVSISDEWAIVGDPAASCGNGTRCGAAYIFSHTGTWDQVARLAPSDLQPDDRFGQSVAMSGDWMAIGKLEAVYLYQRIGASWIQRQKLEPTIWGTYTEYGEHVGMAGERLIVSQRWISPGGAVYFYRLSGGVWVPDGTFQGASGDYLGHSVSMNDDYALVGSTGVGCCGGVYRYRHNGSSWSVDGIMVPSEPMEHEFDDLTHSSIMGNWAIIGRGANVFRRSPDNTWSEVGKLAVQGYNVGSPHSWDGETVLTGGFGTAFLFDLAQTTTDCDCDGQSDSCDVALEGFGDCQQNGIVDSCDLYHGTSSDCGGDLIPDECQEDCQANGVEDSCDIAAGSPDCNVNSRPDECDVANFDCNSNARPDDCDTSNQSNIPDECACITTGAPPPSSEPAGMSKNRFISLVPQSSRHWKAIRVTLDSLHHVDPPYTGAPTVPFSSFEGQVRWVGPPAVYVESSSNPIQFYSSRLRCTPHFQDWSTIDILHVTGSAIVPSSTYHVQFFGANCNVSAADNFSAGLTVQTSRWGDVEVPLAESGTESQPDFGDISAMVNKFRSSAGALSKVRTKLSSGSVDGELNITADVSFESISAAVNAFRGLAYPYTISTCP